MFYHHVILNKKGPLGAVWLAAHFEPRTKLSKQSLLEIKLKECVRNVMSPPDLPISLRTSGHLLVGVMRIYHQRVIYLLADCEEALTRLKMMFRSANVDLVAEAETALESVITLSEQSLPQLTYSDFVQLDELELQPRLKRQALGGEASSSSSYLLGATPSKTRSNLLPDDDSGVGPGGDDGYDLVHAGGGTPDQHVPTFEGWPTVERMRDAHTTADDGSMLFDPDANSFAGTPPHHRHDAAPFHLDFDEQDATFGDQAVERLRDAGDTSMVGELQDAVEGLGTPSKPAADQSAAKQRRAAAKRRTRPVADKGPQISSREYESWLRNPAETCRTFESVSDDQPSTKRPASTARPDERDLLACFRLPGSFLPSEGPLADLMLRALQQPTVTTTSSSSENTTNNSMGTADDSFRHEYNDVDDISYFDVDRSTTADAVNNNSIAVNNNSIAVNNNSFTVNNNSIAANNNDDYGETYMPSSDRDVSTVGDVSQSSSLSDESQSSDQALSKEAISLLTYLNEAVAAAPGGATELSFKQITHNSRRRTVAKTFFELLVLKSHSMLDLHQDAPFADIAISLA